MKITPERLASMFGDEVADDIVERIRGYIANPPKPHLTVVKWADNEWAVWDINPAFEGDNLCAVWSTREEAERYIAEMATGTKQ
jgi:hypothetical protein